MGIHLIANPASGRGRAGKRLPGLLDRLRRAGIAFECHVTGRAGQAREWAASLSRGGAEIVAAVGGDGTIHEVANGLFGSETALAVIPAGTGNDLARTLRVRTEDAAIRALCEGKRKRIDVGRAEDRIFVNVAGTGFDAEVAQTVNAERFLKGTPAYIRAVFVNLCFFRPQAITLTLDGQERQETAMLVAVANARSYGGGMRVAPEASMEDGLFDICLVQAVSRAEFARAFPRVFWGTHTTHPKVRMYRAREAEIRAESPWPVLADGEIVGLTPARFAIVPKALDVIAPGDEGRETKCESVF
ncbi:MAG: diacylglycerol kinase family lipid kinase [Armatimonadetes bacterium]|nr:diacylglycerol kinase family lipid kinase [Armatimonadota bacterium]